MSRSKPTYGEYVVEATFNECYSLIAQSYGDQLDVEITSEFIIEAVKQRIEKEKSHG